MESFNFEKKDKNFTCRYCLKVFRTSKTMLAHLCVKSAHIPCRYCNTMFTTDCASRYHLELCSARPADANPPPPPQNDPAANAISLGTPKKSEPMRSPIRLRESPLKVQRTSPYKNGLPETKRMKTESASPQKRDLPSAAATAPLPLPTPPPQPEVITLIDDDDDDEEEEKELSENDGFAEQENKLALILLAGNEEETYCPICEIHFDNLERHGRSHGMAYLKMCAMRREKMPAKSLSRC